MSDEINRDYERLAEMFRLGETVPLTKDEVDLAEVEARKRGDCDILAEVACWYEDNGDKKRHLEIAAEAAAIGSAKANFWLGCEYRSGENLPRDYEKAYAHYLKAEDWDWVPIDPGENLETMRSLEEYGVVILEIFDPKMIAGILLHTSDYGDKIEELISWWEFVLGKHPSWALKCGLGSWYVSIGELDKGVRLIEESAKEGFRDANSMLAIYYADDSHKDIDRARYWLKEAERAGAILPRTAKKLDVECEAIRRLSGMNFTNTIMPLAILAVVGCVNLAPEDRRMFDDQWVMTLKEYVDGLRAAAVVKPDPKSDFYPNVEELMPSMTTHQISRQFEVVHTDERYVSFRAEMYDYHGGCGNHNTYVVGTISRVDGRILAVRDFVPAAKLPALKAALYAKAVKAIGGKDQLQGEVGVIENFYYAKDGLHFVYNPYEIACGATGMVEVVVDVKELQ